MNDEIRITNQIRMTNDRMTNRRVTTKSPPRVIRFVIRHSKLVILIALLLPLSVLQRRCASAAPASAPADQSEQRTRDIINEINTGQPAPSATAPSGLPEELAAKPERVIDWGDLVWDFRFMLITAGALAVAAAMVGMFVLLRREALLALAIPQVVAVGAAIGMRFTWPTLPPALGTALVALVYFALARRWAASNWIVPSFYIAGLCLSFLIIANHGQDVEELQHLFVGFDVAVSPGQAALAVPVLLIVGLIGALLWRRWLLMAQAPAAAELAGLHPARWDVLFLTLLTIVLLLGTDSLGMVMVLALLFLPAATVLPWVRRIPAAMIASVVIALASLATGFYLSNRMDWPLSQSVGGAGFGMLIISQAAAQFR